MQPVYLRGTRDVLSRVEPGREHSVGTDPQSDIVVLHRTIEVRHAVVAVEGEGLRVRAENGVTLIDGERVERLAPELARAGSNIQLGEITLLVLKSNHLMVLEWEGARGGKRHRDAVFDFTMRGQIDEVEVADLLALFEVSKKNGILVLRRGDVQACIHHQKGITRHVTIGGRASAGDDDARAMVRELLAWTDGTFVLDPPDENPPATASVHGMDLVREYNARVPR